MGCCHLKPSHQLIQVISQIINQLQISNSDPIQLNNLISSFTYIDPIDEKLNLNDNCKFAFKSIIITNTNKPYSKQGKKEEEDEAKLTMKYNKDLPMSFRKDGFIEIMTETNIKDMIYKHLIIKDYEKECFDYFYSIFSEISLYCKYPLMKLILILLFSRKNEKSYVILNELLGYYGIYYYRKEYKETPNLKQSNTILYKYLYYFLKIYIKSISSLMVEFLYIPYINKKNDSKEIVLFGLNRHEQSVIEKDYYINLWCDDNINRLIVKLLSKVSNKSIILIDEFLFDYIELLFNHEELLRMLSEVGISMIDYKKGRFHSENVD